MMVRRKRSLRTAAILTVGILLLAGCGSKGTVGKDQEFVYQKEETSEKIPETGADTQTDAESENAERKESSEQTAEAQSETTEQETESAEMRQLRQTLNIPQTLSAELTAEGGWPCTVDAVVSMEGIDKLEIVTLGERTWDEERTLEYAENLLQGEKLYCRNSEDDGELYELRQTIESLSQALKVGDGKTEQEKAVLKQQLENAENRYSELLKNCEKDYAIGVREQFDQYGGFDGYVDWDTGVREIRVLPHDSHISVEYEDWHRRAGEMTCNLSEEAARSIADSYIKKLGLDQELQCFKCKKSEDPEITSGYYWIEYRDPAIDDQLAEWGAGPRVIMLINDEGLLHLTALGYYTIEGRAPAELKEFGAVWESYLEFLPGYSISSEEMIMVEVTEFKLEYMKPSGSDEILPVWVAHGNIRWSEEENGEKKEEGYYNGIIGRVNAVTGEML